MTYILYNPLAGNGKAKTQELVDKLRPEALRTLDVTTQNLRRFFEKTPHRRESFWWAATARSTISSIGCAA